jgi:glutathione S-transferase
MLKILGKTSSINVRKVLWTCAELGLAYEQEDWGSVSCDRYAGISGAESECHGAGDYRRPTTLWESNTICRYLASKHGRSDLLPRSLRRTRWWNSGWTGRRAS